MLLFVALAVWACGGDSTDTSTTTTTTSATSAGGGMSAGSGGMSAGSGGMSAGSGGTTAKAGRNDHTMMVDGYEREFIVYVSEKALAGGNAPLVMFFHGTNQNGELSFGTKNGMATKQDSGWRKKADEEGLIAVFPTGLNYCLQTLEGPQVQEKWTVKGVGDPEKLALCTEEQLKAQSPADQAKADHPLLDDLNFVDAMVTFVQANYPVDAKRMFLSGFSNGHAYASKVAQTRSKVFVAMLGSGNYFKEDPTPAERAISTVNLLGTKDSKIINLANLQNVFGMMVSELPFNTELLTKAPLFNDEIVANQLEMLQLEDDPTISQEKFNGVDAIVWHYTKSKVGAKNDMRFVLIKDMIHVFPNGTNIPVVGADLAWSFFKDQSLP